MTFMTFKQFKISGKQRVSACQKKRCKQCYLWIHISHIGLVLGRLQSVTRTGPGWPKVGRDVRCESTSAGVCRCRMQTSACWARRDTDADVRLLGAEECRCRRSPAGHGGTDVKSTLAWRRMQARKYSCWALLISDAGVPLLDWMWFLPGCARMCCVREPRLFESRTNRRSSVDVQWFQGGLTSADFPTLEGNGFRERIGWNILIIWIKNQLRNQKTANHPKTAINKYVPFI